MEIKKEKIAYLGSIEDTVRLMGKDRELEAAVFWNYKPLGEYVKLRITVLEVHKHNNLTEEEPKKKKWRLKLWKKKQ